jgi:hypothetical protein
MSDPNPPNLNIPRPSLLFAEVPLDIAHTAREHLALVGLIAALWSQFEADLDTYIISLGKLPAQTGRCVASQSTAPARKLDAYIAIARLRGAEAFISDLVKLAQETTSLAEQRNRVVHDPWMSIHAGGAERLESTARKKLRYEHVSVSLEQMDALVERIRKHHDKLIEIHARIEHAVSA